MRCGRSESEFNGFSIHRADWCCYHCESHSIHHAQLILQARQIMAVLQAAHKYLAGGPQVH
jgi:hypothetical protein